VKALFAAALFGIVVAMMPAAHAQLRSEVKLENTAYANRGQSVDASLGQRDRSNRSLKLRLMWQHAFAHSGWSLDSAYQLDVDQGGEVRLQRSLRQAFPSLYTDSQQRNWWPLSRSISDHGAHRSSQRLDRLSLDYAGEHLVLRIGRQALTWGNGLVFRPMDLFNPFAPDATDTEYKPGSDMLYGQWLFDDGSDLQAVVVPRRDALDRKLASNSSAAGIKWHRQFGSRRPLDVDLMLARDGHADVLGISLGGALGGASWNAEAVPTRLRDGGVRTSLLLNMQYAWSWHGRSVNGYAEVFRNGLGVSDQRPLQHLPPALIERLARGELFTVSRRYLALGADVQWTPLLTLRPGLIGNLDDGSTLVTGQAVYSLSQDVTLTAGVRWPLGGYGSEYGGLAVATGMPLYATPARSVYLRLTWYP
jgi:hypothetical protein